MKKRIVCSSKTALTEASDEHEAVQGNQEHRSIDEEILDVSHSNETECEGVEDQASLITADAYDWTSHARPEQQEPEGDWRLWLILAGRGFGKTRTGAETVRSWVESGRYKRIGLVGATEADIRHVMVEGCSGLLSVYPLDEGPRYEPSKRRIVWPNGAVAYLVSAERYDKLRGLQFDAIWVDELAKFRYPQEAWDQVCLSLRLGQQPRVVVTTTPKPTALIKRLAEPK
ncbi:MAG: DNA-packaging protein, partial [Caedimonadaceae bacterium]